MSSTTFAAAAEPSRGPQEVPPPSGRPEIVPTDPADVPPPPPDVISPGTVEPLGIPTPPDPDLTPIPMPPERNL
jgi:hypothetical protein